MRLRFEQGVTYTVLLLFCAVAVAPLLGILVVALGGGAHFDNFVGAWNAGDLGTGLRNSVVITTTVVVASAVLSVLSGYALGTMRFRGDTLIFAVFLIGVVMPFEAPIVPLYYDLRAFGLTDSYWGVILPDTALSVAFGTFWMRAFFLSTPVSLIEAARIDGASSRATLQHILLPLARPHLLTLMVLVFMWTWNDFLLSLVMLSNPSIQTLPLKLAVFQGRYVTDVSSLASGAVIVMLPVVLVYIILQRHFMRGALSGALKL